MPQPTTNKNVAVAYIRVSTAEQHLGPIAQRDAINAWCAARGVTLAAVFEDRLSSGLPLEKRAGLMDALDAIPVHHAGLLLVAKRDRMARDVVTCVMIERLAHRHGATVVSTAGEGTEDDGPGGQFQRTLFDAFSQYERAMIRARTKSALKVIRDSGRKTGGPCPNGFTENGDGNLEVIMPMLNEVVKAARDGVGARGLARVLNAKRMRTSLGKSWSPTQAARLVENYRARGFLDATGHQ